MPGTSSRSTFQPTLWKHLVSSRDKLTFPQKIWSSHRSLYNSDWPRLLIAVHLWNEGEGVSGRPNVRGSIKRLYCNFGHQSKLSRSLLLSRNVQISLIRNWCIDRRFLQSFWAWIKKYLYLKWHKLCLFEIRKTREIPSLCKYGPWKITNHRRVFGPTKYGLHRAGIVLQSHSRPHPSNRRQFIESLFVLSKGYCLL